MLLGLSKYGGPKEVFERLVLGKQQPKNPRMLRGNREEPRIRKLFVELTWAELAPHPGVIQHPTHDFATVSPDDFALVYGLDATIDYKSVSVWSSHLWGDEFTDAVPDDIACQLHWAMEVSNKEHAFVFAAFGEDIDEELPTASFDIRETRIFRLERDREMAAWMLEVGGRFWREHVLTGVIPENPKSTKRGRAA